jgi:hypothetical protein
MAIADLQTSGYIQKLQNLRETNINYFYFIQAILVIFGFYFGTFPYQQTLGKVTDSMWLPIYWFAPWLWLTVGAACLMVSILTVTEFQHFLSSKICHFLGRISFAVYLLHFIILLLCDILIMPSLGPATNSNNDNDRTVAAFICYIFVILPTTIVSSYCFTIYVDEVAIEYARDFSNLFTSYFPIWCACLTKNNNKNDLGMHTGAAMHTGQLSECAVTLSPLDSGHNKMNADNEITTTSTLSLSDVPQTTSSHGKNSDIESPPPEVEKSYTSVFSLAYLKSIDWKSKKLLLIYFTVLVLIPCCIPSNKVKTCYIDDDNN